VTTHLAAAVTSQGSTLGGTVPAVTTLAIIVLLVITRVRGRPLQPARLLAGPLVLMIVGAGSLLAVGIGSSASGPHAATLHGIDFLIGGADLLDSVVVGTIRGFTVRLYQRDGAAWYRYGPATVALWVLSIGVRVALAVLGTARHASPLTDGGDLLFMLGLALICQNLVVIRRNAYVRAG
jgi:hypothetical protein